MSTHTHASTHIHRKRTLARDHVLPDTGQSSERASDRAFDRPQNEKTFETSSPKDKTPTRVAWL